MSSFKKKQNTLSNCVLVRRRGGVTYEQMGFVFLGRCVRTKKVPSNKKDRPFVGCDSIISFVFFLVVLQPAHLP